jgi:origin recognition complex subunit 4
MSRALHGESNTLLLLGGPGSCKSAIVASALEKLKREHPDTGSFYTIRLDGMIQTDDKIALKEIARQLALEMNVEMEKVSPLTPCVNRRCRLQIH